MKYYMCLSCSVSIDYYKYIRLRILIWLIAKSLKLVYINYKHWIKTKYEMTNNVMHVNIFKKYVQYIII